MSTTRGLILMGGGANAAYQVGVLDAIRELQREHGQSAQLPFQIICGTSAGAINAAALAAWADDLEQGVTLLNDIWAGLHVGDVYRISAGDMLSASMRWLGLITIGGLLARRRSDALSLLDNAPLRELLRQRIPMDRASRMIEHGVLDALAVTAYSYTHGEHVTFYRSNSGQFPWSRSRRLAQQSDLMHEHLIASAAIPFVFPAVELDGPRGKAYFGDGAMGQLSPLSPAIRLGADRIMVISSSARARDVASVGQQDVAYPSLARIAGHTLSSLFMDALSVDSERLGRINRTLERVSPEQRFQTGLRPVELFQIAPSKRIDVTEARYFETLPWTVRRLLSMLGANERRDPGQGRDLISYLLFEGAFTRELIALGRSDVLAQRDEIVSFMGWGSGEGAQSDSRVRARQV